MNIVEFALRLRDMASQPLRQFATAANQTFTRADQMTNNLTTRNRVLGQSYNQLHYNVKQVENTVRTSTIPKQIRAARNELDALQRQANVSQSRIGSVYNDGRNSGSLSGGLLEMIGGFKGMAAGAAIGLAMSAVPIATNFIEDSIAKGLERQQIQTSFNVLAGSEDKGGTLTRQLVGLQKDTILGGEVFQNAQTMMGFGFRSEEIYDNLKMLGDVSMGDAQKLGSLTLAFSQVHAGGKLLGNDLIQFINAGFNPLEIMSQKTGKSIGVLKDEMSKGLITFGMVQQAFKDATSEGGRFENMLGKIAETPAGKVQQLAGEWDEFKVNAGAAFMPLVSMALDLAQKVMPLIEGVIIPLTSGVQGIVDWIKQAASSTGGWMEYLRMGKDFLTKAYLPYIGKLLGFVRNIVTEVIGFIQQSQLLKDIFEIITTVGTVLYTIIGKMVDVLGWLITNYLMVVLDVLDTIYSVIRKIITSAIKWVSQFETVKTIFAVIQTTASIVKGFISNMVDSLKGLYDSVIVPIVDAYKKLKGWAKDQPVTIKSEEVTSVDSKKQQQTTQQILTNIAENAAVTASASKSNEKTISGGGQKIVNIQVAKFLDSINLTSMNMQESTAEIEKIILEMFSRVLVQGTR